MTRNLAAAGHEIVTVLNRSPLPDGITAEVVQSPAEVATQADVTITMLPDTPDVERVLLGKNGVFDGISAGNLVIDMSSISPLMTKDMASQFTAKGVEFVDAPVSGGVVGAESGNLTIMAGGSESAFA